MNRRWLHHVCLLALALIGAISMARLTTGGPVGRDAALAALVGVVVAAAMSARFSPAASLLAGTAAVVLMAVMTSARVATWHGLPTATTLRTLGRALDAVGGVHHFPLSSSPGVLLVGALVAGMAGVATGVIPGAAGLLPVLALVAMSTIALPSGGAWLGVWFAVVSAVALVSSSPEGRGWLAGGGAMAGAILCVAVVGGASGASAVSPGGPPVVGVPPTALSLVSNLTGLQIRDPDLVLFTASTPVPTYWQVTSLSVFNGTAWVPDPETAAALAGKALPVAAAPAPAGATFAATVTVANLSSRLLPVPPGAVAVPGAVLTDAGAVSARVTTPGQRYGVTATVSTADNVDDTSEGSTDTSADTALPPMPPVVTMLARSITGSVSTPLEKAEAITDWLRSDLYHYSLRSSPSSLTAFLTTSRTGSCEQFAGAFAVLARTVGLPTRVAIGFSTGVRDPAGQTVVRGIDAHAWPEVLIGSSWISFEPTPQLPSGELAPPGVIGPAGLGTPNPIGTAPSSIPPVSLPARSPVVVTTPAARGIGWWVVAAAAVAGLLAGTLVVWRRRAGRTPEHRLLLAWQRVDRALGRAGHARPPWRTPTTHVGSLRRSTGDDQIMRDLESLAGMLEEAAYGSTPVAPEDARRAGELGLRLAKTLTSTGRL